MKTKASLRQFRKILVSSCSLITLLSVSVTYASFEFEEEKDIILPAGLPQRTQKTQSIKTVNAAFFEYLQLNPDEARESVINPLQDGRKRIYKTDEFPYSAQVYFVTTFPESPAETCETGSGTFIHPHVILTAAGSVANIL